MFPVQPFNKDECSHQTGGQVVRGWRLTRWLTTSLNSMLGGSACLNTGMGQRTQWQFIGEGWVQWVHRPPRLKVGHINVLQSDMFKQQRLAEKAQKKTKNEPSSESTANTMCPFCLALTIHWVSVWVCCIHPSERNKSFGSQYWMCVNFCWVPSNTYQETYKSRSLSFYDLQRAAVHTGCSEASLGIWVCRTYFQLSHCHYHCII